MYAARLAEAMADTFAKTAEVVGADRFQDLACAYIAEYPSRHPSLRDIGDGFAAFVKHAEAVPEYCGDLAALEWTRLEVFDAPDRAPLTLESWRAVPPDQWYALPMHAIPALTAVDGHWPVHEIWAAP